MTNDEAERQRSELQRDLGRVEGKVDSILVAMQHMADGQIRGDADRDNLARDIAKLDKHHDGRLNAIQNKLYWLGGVAAAGGIGLGASAQKIASTILGLHS